MIHPSRPDRSGRTSLGWPPRAVLAAAATSMLAGAACGSTVPGEVVRREVWGFTAFWDTLSARSVARHGDSLDALVTTWIALDTAAGAPTVLYADTTPAPLGRERMALITTWLTDRFHPVTVRRLAADPAQLAATAGSVARTLAAAGHRGAVLDFEALGPADLPDLLAVVGAIADSLHAHGVGPVTVAVPAGDTLAYPGRALLGAGADFLLPMLYDQHWAGGTAGPVAAPDWVERVLLMRVRETSAARVVAGLPLYGYRWPEPTRGVTVTFAEAERLAAEAGGLSRDSATGTLRAPLSGGGEVWVTDAELLRRLFAIAEAAGVHRFALWYIGQEDPAVWQTILPATQRDSVH